MADSIYICLLLWVIVLNKLKVSDSWFWCRYTINPYRGCAHACIYCDGRSERYYTQPNFDEEIQPKTELPERLLRYIKTSKSLMRDVVATGGVCDSYQPAEETLQITHKLLQIFADTGFALSMSTKSKLILRDCDLLNEIANKTWCAIGVSISTVDDHWASILEPRAANVKDRFEVVKTLKEKCPKAYVGINFMPIIPFISDSIQNIEKTIRLAAEAKADYVLFGVGVTLRDRQREFFFDKMKEYPEIVKMIKNLHSSTKEEWKRYALPKNRLIRDLSEKYKIKIRIPRYIPSDWRRLNYLISEKLFHVAYIKSLEFENQYSEQSVAHYINSLPEPIETIINSKRLDSIPHITEPIKKLILSFEPKPTGLDRFMQYQS